MKQTSERLMPAFFILGLLVPLGGGGTDLWDPPICAAVASPGGGNPGTGTACAGAACPGNSGRSPGGRGHFPGPGPGAGDPYGLFSNDPPGTLSGPGGDTDGAHDRSGANFHHLYGLRRCSQDPDSGFNVLFPGGGELFRWTEPGGCGICASGPVRTGQDNGKPIVW